MTAYLVGNHYCLLIPEECFLCHSLYTKWKFATKHAVELIERLPCPRFWLKVSICVRKKTYASLARRGWLGIIFLITPVFRIRKKRLYIVSKVCSKAHYMDCGIIFVILPLKAQRFWSSVEYHKKEVRKQFKYNENEIIQDQHMKCINETEFNINR